MSPAQAALVARLVELSAEVAQLAGALGGGVSVSGSHYNGEPARCVNIHRSGLDPEGAVWRRVGELQSESTDIVVDGVGVVLFRPLTSAAKAEPADPA